MDAISTKPNFGSFRDPDGQVFRSGRRVFRTVAARKAKFIETIFSSGVVDQLVADGLLVPSEIVDWPDQDIEKPEDGALLLEHEPIPFVSYPYEWTFSALKAAALLHIDFHLRCLDFDLTLSDGTAYNVQFRGRDPVFIDILSLTPYVEGQPWAGYRDFCMQFLNPLMLWAYSGVPFNNWYRGNLGGISSVDLASVLKLNHKLRPGVFAHVVLPARLEKSAVRSPDRAITKASGARVSKNGLVGILKHLRRTVHGLRFPKTGKSVWGDYENERSYENEERQAKYDFVSKAVRLALPETVIDLGCNQGEFSHAALKAGAKRAIGFDFDPVAIEGAFCRDDACQGDFLPLVFDAMNPSPDLGWFQREREGFLTRARGDLVLALAFVHHLAIGRNVPLGQVVEWLLELAPMGVVEFVEKNDPMVQRMLTLREDIFPDYTRQNFEDLLTKNGEILDEMKLGSMDRTLYLYRKR